MIRFAVQAVLLDIEGTTSSISFVYETLFPYARRELRPFLQRHWEDAEVAGARDQLAREAGAANFDEWRREAGAEDALAFCIAQVVRLMDADSKAGGLKRLQGLLWKGGYESGELRSHVYADVPPALTDWVRRGLDVRIYSSGSVAAQRLFFAHSDYGDLLPYFRGHYDTSVGDKKSPGSYAAIARDVGAPARQILFLSDAPAELEAAAAAGMQVAWVTRGPGAEPSAAPWPCVTDFSQVRIEREPMEKAAVTIVAHLRARTGKEAETRRALLGLVTPTRREAGCLNYDLHESPDDPGSFVFYENWTSQAALDAHLASPHVSAVLAQADTLLDGPPQLTKWRKIEPA